MATLTAAQLTELRQQCATGDTSSWRKPEINAALQAIEDYFESTARAGFGSAIETAAPGKFTNARKKRLVGFYLLQKFIREAP